MPSLRTRINHARKPWLARVFKNQKPKFMKPFTCDRFPITGLNDKNRCKCTDFLEYASFFPKKYYFFMPSILTIRFSFLIFAT